MNNFPAKKPCFYLKKWQKINLLKKLNMKKQLILIAHN